MVQISSFFYILLVLASWQLSAQDERDFRSILSGELFEAPPPANSSKWQVSSMRYLFDLNQDKKEEVIQVQKRDFRDFILVTDQLGKILFEAELLNNGRGSKVYKVSFLKLSKTITVLAFHYYEGFVKSFNYSASARLYLLTITPESDNKYFLYKGPLLFEEATPYKRAHSERIYTLDLSDFNEDGLREIVLSQRLNKKILALKNGKEWAEIPSSLLR